MVVVCIAIASGTSAVNWYYVVVLWYCGIVVLWYLWYLWYCGIGCLRLRCACGAPAVRPRYPCGTPSAPLLCAYSIVVVCSAMAADWLRDVSSGATVYSQRRPSDDGGGRKGGDGRDERAGSYIVEFDMPAY